VRPTNAARYCPCCWLNEPHRTERRAAKEEIRVWVNLRWVESQRAETGTVHVPYDESEGP
jgi:hypothetical protein